MIHSKDFYEKKRSELYKFYVEHIDNKTQTPDEVSVMTGLKSGTIKCVRCGVAKIGLEKLIEIINKVSVTHEVVTTVDGVEYIYTGDLKPLETKLIQQLTAIMPEGSNQRLFGLSVKMTRSEITMILNDFTGTWRLTRILDRLQKLKSTVSVELRKRSSIAA